MRKIKIGDRFTTNTYHKGIRNDYEVTDIINKSEVRLIHIGARTPVTLGSAVVKHLTYLGNFSKSENFSNLYDLLSEKPAPHINLENGTNIAKS